MKKGTLIAVGVFVLLLGIFLATRQTQVEEGVRRLVLPAFDSAKVREVDITGANRATLKREGDSWRVEEPGKPGAHPADDGQVRSFLEELSKARFRDIVTDRPERHAELEVDEAKGTAVKVVSADLQKPIELVFGKLAQGGSYVREQGRPEVFVVTGRVGNQARRPASAWRKRGILSVQAADITAITVKPVAGTGYSLTRAGDQWQLARPPGGFRFDSAAAQQLAQQIATVSAQDFAEPGDTDQSLGLAGPHDVVEAKLKDGKALVLDFGQPVAADGGAPAPSTAFALRVQGDAQVYKVAPYTHGAIVKPLAELRDLTLLSFDPTKVKALAVRGPKGVSLQKDGTSWKLVAPKTLPSGMDFDPRQVTSQLNRLKSLRATRWLEPEVPEKKAGLAGAPLVEVTLEDGSRQTLRFGKPVEGGAKQVYVQGTADKRVYAIAEGEKTRLESGLELFKKPPPPPSFDKIKGLSSLPPDIRRQLEAQLKQRAAAGN